MFTKAALAARSVLFALALLASVALALTALSCGTADTATNSTVAPADTTSSAPAPVTTLAPETTTSLPETTTSLAEATTSVDRHDPESILRAYFAAWQRSDWKAEASYMADGYSNMVPEPAKLLRLDEVRKVEGSATHCLFAVAFDFAPAGDVVSMDAGQYDWTYDLNWDSKRQSWIITNYGDA